MRTPDLKNAICNALFFVRTRTKWILHSRFAQQSEKGVLDRVCQYLEIVATFQGENQSAVTKLLGHLDQLTGDVGIPCQRKGHRSQWIIPVSVKAG
jgi:hypothetical protein